MLDGKAANAICEISSAQRCNICKATPTQMNDLKNIYDRKIDQTAFEYGVSPLHAYILYMHEAGKLLIYYIRCFECILHVSYRLSNQKWQVRNALEKEALTIKKSSV